MEELKGLQVSNPVDLNLLQTRKDTDKKVGILSRLVGWKMPVVKFANVQIVQLHHKFTAVVIDNFIELYELQQAEDESVTAKLHGEVDCSQQIQLSCTNWCCGAAGNLRTFLVVTTDRSLQLYLLDLKTKKLVRKSDYSLRGIRTANFLGQNKLVVMTDTGQLINFECTTGTLSRKLTLKVNLQLPVDKKVQISSSFLLGSLSDDHEEIFYYFFFTCQTEVQTFIETVYVKEFIKRNEGIEQGQTYKVYQIETSKMLFKNAKVVREKDCFGIVIDGEIEIVKKRHNGYYFFDTILRKRDHHTLFMLEDGVVCSVESKSVELARLMMTDLKCQLKTIDVIYYDCIQKDYVFKAAKPIMLDKVQTYALFFTKKDDPSVIRVLTMKKIEGIKKLLDLVKIKELHLPFIQELGINLGISKKDFYLKLWSLSQKELADVNDKLLETEDVATIKRQMKFFLRRKRVPLFELGKVYKRIYKLIEAKLRVSLDAKMLKDYLKIHFLTRKLKIQPDMITTIGFVEFMEIKKKSIVEILHECITNDIKLSVLSTKDREKQGKQILNNQKIMRDVLSEFRIVLLENYDSFLKQVITPFSTKLNVIFEKYSFMLPRHPYQAEFKLTLSTKDEPENIALNKSIIAQLGGAPQPKIFNAVKESEWNEEMSREGIIRELSEYNLTSTVTSTIDAFVSSSYYNAKRLTTHALIPSTRAEYIEHIERNSGSRLFLKACQFANELNLNNNSYSPKMLVEKFQKNNNLNGEELIKCTFYSELHLFMLRYNVGSNPCMEKLLSLSEEDLIAVFFLGNQQKHNLILKELRTLYDDAIISRNTMEELSLFDGVMEKFVASENCSPVEIKLLTQSIKQMGVQFQQMNQSLIRIIINGFCMRLQVREEDRIEEFIQMFDPVHLSQQLNERMMRVMKIKELASLFEHFHCQKESVLLVQKEGKIVLSRVLQNYFLGDIKATNIMVDGQFITLDTPRNMLNILLYLQEKLYPEVTEWQVLIIFGERMIDYEVFDVLTEIIHDDNVLNLLGIDPVEYTEMLIHNTLDKIYNEEAILSFDSVKDHMHAILKLQRERTPNYKVEQARIRLCELVSESDFEITPYRIYHLKAKDQFMIEFIEKGFESITLPRLFEIYQCFQIIDGEEHEEYDTELLNYLARFAQVLKTNGKLLQAIEVLIYLLEHDCFEELYPLVTEVLILTLQSKYPEDFNTARIYLECYAFNYESKSSILDALKYQFDADRASMFDQHISQITLHESLTFMDWRKVTLDLSTLESIAREVAPKDAQFYRYYYFLLIVLTQPERGFWLTGVDYDYLLLESCLEKVGATLNAIDEKNQSIFTNLNEYELRTQFFKGLWNEAENRTQPETRHDLDLSKHMEDDYDFVNIINLLRERKDNEMVKILNKCQKYLTDKRNQYRLKLKKIEKYQNQVNKNIEDVQIELPRPSAEELGSKSFVETKLNRTMTLGQFLEEACNVTINHPNLNQRQVINMVWGESGRRNKGASPAQTKPQTLSDVIAQPVAIMHTEERMIPVEEDDQVDLNRREYVFGLFDQSKYFQIESLDRDELLKYMKQYYESDRNVQNIIKLMQAAKVGQDKNIKIVQSALRIQTPIDIKRLFSFDYYFFVPEHASPRGDQAGRKEGSFYWQIFNYLTPILKQMITYDNVLELSKTIYISLKYEKEFEYEIYLFALEKLLAGHPPAETADFNKRSEQYITKLSISRRFLMTHYRNILEMCRSREDLELIRQKLLVVLRRKDMKDNGQEAVDQTMLDEAIAETEDFQLE